MAKHVENLSQPDGKHSISLPRSDGQKLTKKLPTASLTNFLLNK